VARKRKALKGPLGMNLESDLLGWNLESLLNLGYGAVTCMQANVFGTPILISRSIAFMLLGSAAKDGGRSCKQLVEAMDNRNMVCGGQMEAHEKKEKKKNKKKKWKRG